MKKKPAMVLSFALGSILFATTAFAEVNSKSGYVQMKDALKFTADSFSTKLSSYTTDVSMVMKDNGNIITQENQLKKYDTKKGAAENKATNIREGKTIESYNYSDKNSNIYLDSQAATYYENIYEKPEKWVGFTDPFKGKSAGDLEKILDAVIGNLKDYVVVNTNADGTKQLTGTISEAQIPAIANALVSYEFKSSIGNSYNNNDLNTKSTMPKIADDIYVKEIKGNMTLSKDGLMQSGMISGSLSGKDDKGKDHSFTFEILAKISDVNKTVVNKPDFTGKKVITTNVQNDKDMNKISKPEMYIGSYKQDIVIEKDNKFQKIGERIVDITSLDDKNVVGRYHEEYTKGNEAYSSKAKDVKFTSEIKSKESSNFVATDSAGNKFDGSIFIFPQSSCIDFNINGATNQSGFNNGQYNRVFN